MRLFHIVFLGIGEMIAACACAITLAIEGFVDLIAVAFPPDARLRMLADAAPGNLAIVGLPVDRATQNDMRHEANVSRRSAPRNI